MWCDDKLFYLCLCFTMIECYDEPDELSKLKSSTTTKRIQVTRINENTSECLIGNNKFEVYSYGTNDPTYQNYDNDTPTIISYTCMNCAFAIWTLDKLFRFVSYFPLLYQPEFVNIENDLISKNVSLFFDILIRVRKETISFIDILLNFVEVNKFDPSIDTDFLKTLLTLNLKINYIHTMYNKKNHDIDKDSFYSWDDTDESQTDTSDDSSDENDDETDGMFDSFKFYDDKYLESFSGIIGSDDTVIRMVLETMNSIQHFIIINCKFAFPNYNNKPFYGFTNTESDSEKFDITHFLEDISPINLETSCKCNIEQIMLSTFVSSSIKGAEWNTGDGKILIEHVYQEVEKSYDLEIVFWYQELVYRTIIKLLFSIIMRYLKDIESLSIDVLNDIKYVQSEILSVSTDLPADLTVLYEKFKTIQDLSNRNRMINDIENYLISLNDITVDSKRFVTLDVFVYQFKSIKNDFQCFFRLFVFLREQDNLYYIPFKNNKIKIESFVQNIKLKINEKWLTSKQEQQLRADEVIRKALDSVKCNYVISLYHYCFEATIAINYALTGYLTYNKEQYYTEARNMISYVKQIAIDLINKYWDLPLFKILYSIVPLLEIYLQTTLGDNYAENLKRLVHVIMAELNKYGIEFCKPPDYNFLLFNNINFDKIGKLSTQINKDIKTSMGVLQSDNIKHEYTDLKTLYKTVEDRSADLAAYDKIIKLKWKGREVNFTNVYKHITSGILNSSYLYAFYDFCFQFSIATIFYESHYKYIYCRTYKPSDDHCAQLNDQIETTFKLLDYKFPKKFMIIVPDFHDYLKNVYSYCCNKRNTDQVVKEFNGKIINYLHVLGISIDLDTSKSVVQKPPSTVTKKSKLSQITWNRSTKSKTQPMQPTDQKSIFKQSIDHTNNVLQFGCSVGQQFNNINAFVKYSSSYSSSITSKSYLTVLWDLINHQSLTPP